MDFGYCSNKVAYCNCRECGMFTTVVNGDGTGGSVCWFLRDGGNYLPFSTVFSKEMLEGEIADYKENPLPDKCPFYSQSCLSVFSGDDEPSGVALEEWADYSRISKVRVSDVDFSVPLFSRLRDIDPSFSEWTETHGSDWCWILAGDGGEAAAFAHISEDADGSDYSWVLPKPREPLFGSGRRRIRISHLVCDDGKARFGRMGILRIAFFTALREGVDEMYAVTYPCLGNDDELRRSGFVGGYWSASNGDDCDAAQAVHVVRLDRMEAFGA